MNRETLRNQLPDLKTWMGRPPEAWKAIAEKFIDDILAAFAAEKREPDAWETLHLATAIGFMASKLYRLAIHYAFVAIIEPSLRNVDQSPPVPLLASISQLKQGYEKASGPD